MLDTTGHQTVPNNFVITKESLSDLVGRALWWAENKGPVILFCGPVLAQAIIDGGFDECWVDILPHTNEPLNPDIVEVGEERVVIPKEIDELIASCCERQEIVDKLIKAV